jgi:hypothetical protein
VGVINSPGVFSRVNTIALSEYSTKGRGRVVGEVSGSSKATVRALSEYSTRGLGRVEGEVCGPSRAKLMALLGYSIKGRDKAFAFSSISVDLVSERVKAALGYSIKGRGRASCFLGMRLRPSFSTASASSTIGSG